MTAENSFNRNILISVFGHICVVLIIFFRAISMPDEPIQIRNAIRVDVVGLPQKNETLPEKVPEKPSPAPAPKKMPAKAAEPVKPKAPTVALDKKEKKKDLTKAEKRALEKLKAMEALEKIEAEVGKAKSTKPKATAVAGNKVSEGNSLTGLEKIDYDRYFDSLESKVHAAWSIPQWLADGNFKASVQVQIDENGNIIHRVFKKTSGNDIFDAKVVEALDNSSPFPPPPARLRGAMANRGVIFNFPQ